MRGGTYIKLSSIFSCYHSQCLDIPHLQYGDEGVRGPVHADSQTTGWKIDQGWSGHATHFFPHGTQV